MASKKLSTDTSLANSYKLSRGVASVARPSAPTIGTATDGGSGNMSVTFTASTLGPTASSFSLTSSSGVTGSGASSPLTLQEAATGTYTYSVSGTNANGTGPSSAASNSVVVASVFAPSGAYDSIATTTVGSGGASSITFSSIPQTYTHLQIRGITRTPLASYITARFNADTGSNYSTHYIYAEPGTVVSGGAANDTVFYVSRSNYSASASTMFGAGICDILDYSNTNKYKTTRTLTGNNSNGTAGQAILISSGNWRNTAAVTSIVIFPTSGDFSQYSSFALYGIKGA
jgi:hypothetical protein